MEIREVNSPGFHKRVEDQEGLSAELDRLIIGKDCDVVLGVLANGIREVYIGVGKPEEAEEFWEVWLEHAAKASGGVKR